MWDDLLAAVALVLVLEGMTPFLNPRGMKEAMQFIMRLPERVLRIIGLASMVIGALLLYWVRHS